MNRILSSIIALAAFFVPLVSSAQGANDMGLGANERVVGFTTTNDCDAGGAVFGEAGTYTIGIWLGPEQLSFYAGCRILGMRVAVTTDIGRTSVFMNSIANGVMTPVKNQKQRIYAGWNRIDFNGDFYEITGEEELFIGYDYVEGESVDQKLGAIGVTGDYQDGSFYYYTDNKFYTITNAGKLCVQLIIDATNMPEHNMAFTFFDTGFRYHKSGEKLDLFATVANVGKEPLSEFTVAYSFDNGDVQYDNVKMAIGVDSTCQWQKVVDMPAEIGEHLVTVSVAKLNGADAPVHRASSVSSKVAVYKETMPRQQLYMEVFTDQLDPYSGLLNSSLEDMKKLVGDDVCVAKLHNSNTVLAADGADLWWELYAYATPVFTSNRSYFPGETTIAYCVNDYILSMPFIIPSLLADIVSQDAAQPSFASVDLATSYDPESRKLDVTVSGRLLPEAEAILGDVGLTVMLVEDSVRSYQTIATLQGDQYVTSTDRRYIHNDVMRTYLSSPTGTKIDASGETYTQTFSTAVQSNWKPENMRVIAYMSKVATDVNADNLKEFDIIQANSARVVVPTGVGGVEVAPADGPAVYYTLNGVPADGSNLASGVYIKRYADGRTEKILVK